MFGCCCNSSGKTAIIAALVGAAGVLGGAVLTRSLDNAGPEAGPAVVVPTSHQPEAEMTPEQMMAAMAGTWDATAKFWMAPDAPPTESKGVSESELILGGRFVSQHFTMPDFMGVPFEGYGVVGFDKAKGKYINAWIDNFGTGMMTMEGEADKDSHTVTWTGSMVYPGPEGVTETPVKHIIKHDGPDKMVMEFWEPPAPGEDMVKTGEITYTRRK
jgi:hypothetical protein